MNYHNLIRHYFMHYNIKAFGTELGKVAQGKIKRANPKADFLNCAEHNLGTLITFLLGFLKRKRPYTVELYECGI